MNIFSEIDGLIKKAMQEKCQGDLRALRSIKSALLIEKTNAGWDESKADDVGMKVLQKQAKQRKDSLEIFEKQNRPDLADKEKEELELIESLLPASLSEEQVTKIVDEIIAQVGANSMKDMGKVMGMASSKLAGQADGKVIATVVKSRLS
jgi:uncharacterized protein YqeY